MKRTIAILSLLALLPFLGCSEDDVGPDVVDTVPPDVVLLHPTSEVGQVLEVSDSVDVYVAARDLDSSGNVEPAREVELWFLDPEEAERRPIATLTDPLTSVPDSMQGVFETPEGYNLYGWRWYTGPKYPNSGTYVPSGRYVQLLALAKDAEGNVGSTDPFRLRVLNEGDSLRPPRPDFRFSPAQGNITTVFSFDPGTTEDDLDALNQIQVRWDFDGDFSNGWDIDWDDEAYAHQVQQHQFQLARTYRVTLEARNSYLPETRTRQRDIGVTPIGGNPDPPHGDYILVRSGTYTRGDSSYVYNNTRYSADGDESPIHQVTLTQDYLIERTEVTNQLYMNYLTAAIEHVDPVKRVTFNAGAIAYYDIVPPADSLDIVYLQLENSRIFYDLDRQAFRIEPGFEDHPVTGVSWFGANHYAISYGLRLPTEGEWEMAARGAGGGPAIDFPWAGSESVTTDELRKRVNFVASTDPFEQNVGMSKTSPVGFYDGRVHLGFETLDTPSVLGLYDLSGNVSEWVGDWFGSYPTVLQRDPAGPQVGQYKITRGGSYLSSAREVRASYRAGLPPGGSYVTVGFRTAYFPTP